MTAPAPEATLAAEPPAPARAASLGLYAWGVGGVFVLLLEPAARLGVMSVRGLRVGLTPAQWVFAVVWTLLIGYAEGYRAFQLRFVPRVVARALELARDPRPGPALLAPFYAMSLFGDARRRVIVSWVLVLAIVGVSVGVRHVSQPFRALIDGGVSLALLWGCVCIVAQGARAWRTR